MARAAVGLHAHGVVGATGDASHETVVVLGVTAGMAPRRRQRGEERRCPSGVRPCDVAHRHGHLFHGQVFWATWRW